MCVVWKGTLSVDTGAARMDVLIEMVSVGIRPLGKIEEVGLETVFLLKLRRRLRLIPCVHGDCTRESESLVMT